MIDYGWFTVLFVSFLVGSMSNRYSIIWLARLFLLFMLVLLYIIWQAQHGWPGFFNVQFALFAYWPIIAAVVGLAIGAHIQPPLEEPPRDPSQDKPFPLYLLRIGNKREFVPVTHMYNIYRSPHEVQIEGLALNDDFSVRDLTTKEERDLRQIAKTYSSMK